MGSQQARRNELAERQLDLGGLEDVLDRVLFDLLLLDGLLFLLLAQELVLRLDLAGNEQWASGQKTTKGGERQEGQARDEREHEHS